jgi:hypothetical protein
MQELFVLEPINAQWPYYGVWMVVLHSRSVREVRASSGTKGNRAGNYSGRRRAQEGASTEELLA